MTVFVKKDEQVKEIQTENLNYYKSEGWVEVEKPAPAFKKAKRHFEENREEE